LNELTMAEDTFRKIREAGIVATTGLAMTSTDDDLRNGTHESRRLHAHRKKHHGDEHNAPIHYPAGKPLLTEKEIIAWRNAQSGTYKLDNWLFKDFRNAYKYAMGKPARTRQGYTLQQGKHPKQT
jgi:hypothetical protein|tara:strand:- start:2767 stop:3141 length:375 start_codon:yes stop_codon:yes gene_type:complete